MSLSSIFNSFNAAKIFREVLATSAFAYFAVALWRSTPNWIVA